ncbi:hypothetical protein N1851_005691 [Merluccius polli]|uniref:Uncharacterized protein n=1 Tax=Merluccius polli TaxID=89951 RepID=A0AA47PA21_MERPO|nr:hypothetical protein N1851_005691 [Merluccius polli]
MQSLTHASKTGPEPWLLTETDMMMKPGERKTQVQLLEAEIVDQPQDSDGVTPADGKEAVVQPSAEPTVDSEGKEMDHFPNIGSLEAPPERQPGSASDGGTVGKIEEANDRRRYLSCMKNRRDPLLMDMPEGDSSSLTCEYNKLQTCAA